MSIPAVLDYPNFIIGLVVSLSMLGWFLPQIFTANYTQKLGRRKDFVLLGGLGERIPFFRRDNR